MAKTLNFLTPDRVKELLLSDPPPPWPEGIRVVDVTVEERVDSTGDDALYVVLTVPDETTDEVLESPVVDVARNIVRDVLKFESEPRFAYVRVLRLAEVADADGSMGNDE